FVEGDLPTLEATERVRRHLTVCAVCEEYCRQLAATQSFIRSHFKSDSRNQASLTSVRRNVMSQIDETQNALGWATKLERFITLGLRRQRYAVAGFAIAAVLSVSLVGQIQHSGVGVNSAAVFIGKDTLARPVGYREWIFVGSSIGLSYSENGGA